MEMLAVAGRWMTACEGKSGVVSDEPGEGIRSQSEEFRLYPEGSREFLTRAVRRSDFTKQCSKAESGGRLP